MLKAQTMLLQSCTSSEEPRLPPLTELCGTTCPLQVVGLVLKLAGMQLAGGNHPGLGAKAAPGHQGYLSFRQGGFPALSEVTWWRHLRATGNVAQLTWVWQPRLLLGSSLTSHQGSQPLLSCASCWHRDPGARLGKVLAKSGLPPEIILPRNVSL